VPVPVPPNGPQVLRAIDLLDGERIETATLYELTDLELVEKFITVSATRRHAADTGDEGARSAALLMTRTLGLRL
jgi:hypothetical protein